MPTTPEHAVLCEGCESEYVQTIGDGRKYCRLCKKALNSIGKLGGLGRRANFPEPSLAMRMLVMNDLESKGWKTSHVSLEQRYRLITFKNWYSIRIAVGAHIQDRRWADVVAYVLPVLGTVVYEASCIRGVVSQGETGRKRRGACGEKCCKPCVKAMLVNLTDPALEREISQNLHRQRKMRRDIETVKARTPQE